MTDSSRNLMTSTSILAPQNFRFRAESEIRFSSKTRVKNHHFPIRCSSSPRTWRHQDSTNRRRDSAKDRHTHTHIEHIHRRGSHFVYTRPRENEPPFERETSATKKSTGKPDRVLPPSAVPARGGEHGLPRPLFTFTAAGEEELSRRLIDRFPRREEGNHDYDIRACLFLAGTSFSVSGAPSPSVSEFPTAQRK